MFSPEYASWVSQLIRGLSRLDIAPELARIYSLHEIDLMIAIRNWQWTKRKKKPQE